MNTMYFFTSLRLEDANRVLARFNAASQFVPPSARRPLTVLVMPAAVSVKFDTVPAVVEKETNAIWIFLSLPAALFSAVSNCSAMLLTAAFAT